MIEKNNIRSVSKALLIFLLTTILLSASCGLATTRPKLDMSLAAAAFIAAKNAKAQSMAPGFFRKAEFYYLKAKSAYKRKYYNKAKQYSILSRKYSEKAEYVAIRKATLENI
jgi:hypothetical protein